MLNEALPNCSPSQKRALFRYLFGDITQREFKAFINNVDLAKSMIGAIHDGQHSGYILKNCKLYIYSRLFQTTSSDEYDIHPSDVAFLRTVNIDARGVKPFSLHTMDKHIGLVLNSREMQSYINKLVIRKMTFLIRSYNYTREDLCSMLIEAAVYALLKQYPLYKSKLHFQNIAKTTIRNTAMTFITSSTTAKRKRLQQNSDGTFSSLMVPIDTFNDGGNLEYQEHHLKESIEDLAKLSEIMPPKVRRYFAILGGLYDETFSEYLGRDNSEAVERMSYEVYRRRLEEFMGITREQTERVMKSVRNHFGV